MRYFAQEYHPTAADEMAVLASIGYMDIDMYQRNGINKTHIDALMLGIQQTRAATPCVSVDAQALETVVSLAALAIDADDPLSKAGEFIDDMAAIEKVRTVLRR